MGEERGNKFKNPNIFQTDFEKTYFSKNANGDTLHIFSLLTMDLGFFNLRNNILK